MNNKTCYLILSTFMVMNIFTGKALAGEWTITPSVTISETYSDNITLAAPGSEQDDYVTQVNPSIKINGKGKRLELDFDYTMQNIYYAESSGSDETKNKLSAKAKATLVEDFFFMDASASMRQQNTTLVGSSTQDNVSVVSDRADVQTISVSPYLKHNFANWFEGSAKYSFSTTEYDQSVSDSESNNVSLSLNSGKKFKKLKWSASYSKQEQDRDNQSDIEKENIKGAVSYALNHKFDAVVQGGDEDNNLGTGVTRANGGYWSAGFNYHPSYHLALRMTGGENEQTASLTLAPTKRTSLLVSLRDADVGTSIGEQWSGLFAHRTKRSTWRLTYLEDTTTSQSETPDREEFFSTYKQATVADYNAFWQGSGSTAFGDDDEVMEGLYVDPVFGIVGTEAQFQSVDLYPLSDEVYQREVLSASVNYKTGKSDITLSLSNQKRLLEVSKGTDTILSTGLSWKWKHNDRMSSNITGSWSQIEADYGTVNEYDVWSAGWDVTRTLSENASATLGVRRAAKEVSSGVATEYDENRVHLSLQVKF